MNPLGNDPERQSEAMGRKMPLSCHDAAVVGEPRGDGARLYQQATYVNGMFYQQATYVNRHVLRIPQRPACAARIRNRHVPESWTESCFRSTFRGRARHSSWPDRS
jgi:hypothetical protein